MSDVPAPSVRVFDAFGIVGVIAPQRTETFQSYRDEHGDWRWKPVGALNPPTGGRDG